MLACTGDSGTPGTRQCLLGLGAPAFPDDPLRFTGTVTGKSTGSPGDQEGENFVEVSFQGANSLGNHVSGTAVLSLLDEGFEKDQATGQA